MHDDNLDEIYREAILELNRHPLNKKKLADFDLRKKQNNPLCGDEIEIFLKFDKSDKVADVGFQGEGCAISQASASLLTDYVKGKTKKALLKMTHEDMLKILGIENLNPSRQRCATLALKTLQNGLE